jgi:hypothetical protein
VGLGTLETERGGYNFKKVEAPSKCPEKWLIKLLSHIKKLCPKVS